MLKNIVLVSFLLVFVISCSSDRDIERVLKKNPKIITNLIEENPSLFIETFQNAARKAQLELAQKREKSEKQKLEDSFNNPLKPFIHKNETFRGNPTAPITIIEYSDFQCPFCTKGAQTVEKLMAKYKGQVRFLFKHLPLDFHPQAMLAAKYYEAVKLQDAEKAFQLHDLIFSKQGALSQGESFLNKLVKKVGADLEKIKKDLQSDKVSLRIHADMAEAKKFNMQGTPGFIINGIPVRGAYPAEYFVGIIDELVKRKKLKL